MSMVDSKLLWLSNASREEQLRFLREHPELADDVAELARGALRKLSPLGLALTLDSKHRTLPHLDYLDRRLAQAVKDVERGKSRFIRVSMPPRSGKSVTSSEYLPLWLLSNHPDWPIGLISHSPSLASGWGRQVRRLIEAHGPELGLHIASDAGAVTDWETTKGGGVSSRSVGQSITGRGFKVLIVDDVVKDYADAASETKREAMQDWWQTTARTRIEPPSLVVVIGTRWHEGDFTGWVSTTGDDFEIIEFPAIALDNDVLGREPGDPLFSPFIVETREEALARWDDLKTSVGPYAWAALYQQDPKPAGGAIFKEEWWRYWTTDPDLVSETTVLLDPSTMHSRGTWVDSWDIAIQDTENSDYSVGQRWFKDNQGRSFLVGQSRTQTTFTNTLEILRKWGKADSLRGTGGFVSKRLIEQAANGYALIDTLKKELSGVTGIIPRGSKEVRAMACTPEVARGDVYLPHPAEDGNSWVHGLLGELAAFPTGKHDDQVDALTQALNYLRGSKPARATSATHSGQRVPSNQIGAAQRAIGSGATVHRAQVARGGSASRPTPARAGRR